MVTRKMKIVIKILPNTVYNLSPPQARKNHFIWMGLLYGAFSPGTTCWPGGVPKCSTGVGVKKWPPGGVDLLFTPPTHTYGTALFKECSIQSTTLLFQPICAPARNSPVTTTAFVISLRTAAPLSSNAASPSQRPRGQTTLPGGAPDQHQRQTGKMAIASNTRGRP